MSRCRFFLVTLVLAFYSNIWSANHYLQLNDAKTALTSLQKVEPNTLIDVCCDVNSPTFQWNIPADCVIRYSGGTLNLRSVNGKNTMIDAPARQLFGSNTAISGSWNVEKAYPEWFGGKGDDNTLCDQPISKSFKLSPSEVHFSRGTYLVNSTITTNGPDIYINRGATIKMRSSRVAVIKADYTLASSIYTMQVMPRIHGGGCIDGNNVATIGIVLRYGRCMLVEDLLIKNITQYGLQAAGSDKDMSGYCHVYKCIFENESSNRDAIAINNNRTDCIYDDINIVNFRIAVRHAGAGGKFTNVSAWLTDSSLWNGSVVFSCEESDLTLYNCEADTMQKLLKIGRGVNYFFANIINCRAFKNNDIVPDRLARQYPPLIIDKNGSQQTQIFINGGAYWFDVPYNIIENLSSFDNIRINRYHRDQIINHANSDR